MCLYFGGASWDFCTHSASPRCFSICTHLIGLAFAFFFLFSVFFFPRASIFLPASIFVFFSKSFFLFFSPLPLFPFVRGFSPRMTALALLLSLFSLSLSSFFKTLISFRQRIKDSEGERERVKKMGMFPILSAMPFFVFLCFLFHFSFEVHFIIIFFYIFCFCISLVAVLFFFTLFLFHSPRRCTFGSLDTHVAAPFRLSREVGIHSPLRESISFHV